MREEPGKEKDANNKDPVEEEDGKESEELQLPKISTYVTAVPTAVQKLKRLTAAKKPVITESPPKLLEGPFGLGSLVSPAFQRFNNIDFFTFLYFVVVTGHAVTTAGTEDQQVMSSFSVFETAGQQHLCLVQQ
ncbi:hypothetical protein I79_013034 [Cricetulus griseus]|uniref:Uncharacterized protein n=1 Tax=Cricetulus griseus TaxID=10029 RepID=G3HQD7_CRIGR|nr:hypothetical protein I79_013034 [Cricetulus griseus]